MRRFVCGFVLHFGFYRLRYCSSWCTSCIRCRCSLVLEEMVPLGRAIVRLNTRLAISGPISSRLLILVMVVSCKRVHCCRGRCCVYALTAHQGYCLATRSYIPRVSIFLLGPIIFGSTVVQRRELFGAVAHHRRHLHNVRRHPVKVQSS